MYKMTFDDKTEANTYIKWAKQKGYLVEGPYREKLPKTAKKYDLNGKPKKYKYVVLRKRGAGKEGGDLPEEASDKYMAKDFIEDAEMANKGDKEAKERADQFMRNFDESMKVSAEEIEKREKKEKEWKETYKREHPEYVKEHEESVRHLKKTGVPDEFWEKPEYKKYRKEEHEFVMQSFKDEREATKKRWEEIDKKGPKKTRKNI